MSVVQLSNGRTLYIVGGVVYSDAHDALEAYKATIEQ